MKLNEHVKIVGNKVILIPYERRHVNKYHQWMQDPELQQSTASEPLTIEEEFEMQISWREDEDKCTFLILDKAKYLKESNEIDSLVGDTNLYLNEDNKETAEIEIMIGESSALRKGFGYEAVLLMLKYGIEDLRLTNFKAIIGERNNRSISLFTKLQFAEYSRTPIFGEIKFTRSVTKEWVNWLNDNIVKYNKAEYIC